MANNEKNSPSYVGNCSVCGKGILSSQQSPNGGKHIECEEQENAQKNDDD